MGGVHDERVEALALGGHQPEPFQPLGWDPTGGGLPLADLVAVDDEDVGTGARQLACNCEPGEAGAADQNVALAA